MWLSGNNLESLFFALRNGQPFGMAVPRMGEVSGEPIARLLAPSTAFDLDWSLPCTLVACISYFRLAIWCLVTHGAFCSRLRLRKTCGGGAAGDGVGNPLIGPVEPRFGILMIFHYGRSSGPTNPPAVASRRVLSNEPPVAPTLGGWDRIGADSSTPQR